ncbi:extracellular solute-binding protein [Paenibacillus sepulcri]|uniref:Extracellular solute-binding protein n=1 Tax=Paenibacillus sepulcri TaxID=359917 RepID=A0ABS7C6U4_9BACL|nr:extracellular solute-binding protein [Paenibacillus sepulcri]
MRKMWSKKVGTILFMLTLVLAVAGCGSNNGAGNTNTNANAAAGNANASGNETGTAAGNTADPTAGSTAENAAGNAAANAPAEDPNDKSDDEPLTVYLNDFDEIIGPEFEKATGYKVNLVVGNGAETMSRIEAEKGNPHWDVVWMDALPSIHSLGEQGQLLEGWQPENLKNLTDFTKPIVPTNNAYFPTGVHAAGVIIYNTKLITADKAPKSWADLAKPEYKGLVGMADPAVAAPAYPFVSWFFENKGMDEGKTFFKGMLDNGMHVYPKNPNVATAVAGGEIQVAAIQESNAYTLKKDGEPIEIVWPEEGAPASVRVAAIQKESTHMKAAKAFIEFLLDPKTQQYLIDQGAESYFEPSAVGVNAKDDRAKDTKLVYAQAPWAAEHEAEIKQWFADQSVK